ncbi:hypothetical protein ACQPZZ_01960 [Microbispora sp. CA-135349]|uniref:hypothetical protein n=1 Tax=Microbispora sp. CA-135349 TaxID=3239953 RepID=UPI003D8A3397
MMRKLISLAAVAGAVIGAVAVTGAGSASASSTTFLRLPGGPTLEIPRAWRVHRSADQVHVVTGACAKPTGHYFEPGCRGFWVMGAKTLKTGGEGFRRYNPVNGPFYPAVDVAPCPANPKLGHVLGKAIAVGYRNIGQGHKAHYRVWPGRCVTYDDATEKSTFTQREWYLPKERLLIVDQWATPGLATVLKNATWAS